MRVVEMVALSLVAVAAGCASGGGSGTGAPVERTQTPVRIEAAGAAYTVDLVREDQTTTGWVDAPIDQVWRHAVEVFLGLGFDRDQLAVFSTDGHRIGVSNARVRRLAGKRLSSFLDCGFTLGAPRSDRGGTRITLTTWLESANGRTAVHTRFEATARDSGTSTAPVSCASRGKLEEQIMERIQGRLGTGTR